MKLGLSFDYKNKGVKDAKRDIVGLGKSFLKTTVGIGSASVAISKLNGLLKESVQAALADEKAYKVLGQTLKTAGFEGATDSVKALIDSQQLATGVAEDQLIPAYTTLFNALESVSSAQYSLKLAQDVALATGKDLTQVTSAFAKAAKGSTTALGRLGIGLSKAELASGDFASILTTLENKFGGTTAAAIDTASVRMDRLRVAVSEAKEEIGKGLVDAFDRAAGASDTSVAKMQANIIRFGTTVGDFFRGTGGLLSKLQTEIPPVVTETIKSGIRQGFGIYGDVAIALTNYGEALREQTEKSAAAGLASAYTGGPRADRPSIEDVGRAQFIQRQRLADAEERRRRALEAKRAAELRAQEAAKKRQAELNKLIAQKQIQYDSTLAGLAAASAKSQTAETQQRIIDLATIQTATYAADLGLTTMEQILQKVNEQFGLAVKHIQDATSAQGGWTNAITMTAAEVSRLQGLYANATPGSAAQFRIGQSLADAGVVSPSGLPANQLQQAQMANQSGITINNNFAGGTFVNQTELQNAIANAVNQAARAGSSFNRLPQAL